MPKAGAQRFIGDAFAQRLTCRVGVDVDQPGNDQPVAAIDFPISLSLIAAPDMNEPAISEGDVDVTGVDVLFSVPDDSPIGMADNGCGHAFSPCLCGTSLRRKNPSTHPDAEARQRVGTPLVFW